MLLTRVIYLKPGAERNFAIVDAAMNDLIRPALYDAWHAVDPVRARHGPAAPVPGGRARSARAPISSPTTAISRSSAGDLLAVRAAGAYAFAMSSNYNSRPRACEVIVDGDRVHLARPRETRRRTFRARIAAALIARRNRAMRIVETARRARKIRCAKAQQSNAQGPEFGK